MSNAAASDSAPLYRWGREMQSYDAEQMKTLLGAQDDAELCRLVAELKSAAVLRTFAKKTEVAENAADEVWNKSALHDTRYAFCYVGMLQNINKSGWHLLYLLPKYEREVGTELQPEEEKQRMQQFQTVLQVINRYNQNNKTLAEESEVDTYAKKLRVKIELLMDYVANGAYRDDEHVDEINGNGRILWQRTIQKTLPYLADNGPVYMELHTRRKQDDDQNFFTRLHHYLAYTAYEYLEQRHICSLLGLPAVPLQEDETFDFQERDYVLNRLAGELCVQFDSRRRWLLLLMERYLKDEDGQTENGLLVFGKSGFHAVWEEACRTVLNMRKATGEDMPLSRPKWELWGDGKRQEKAAASLEADMFCKTRDSLLICDAKYYAAPVAGNIDSVVCCMPQVGDIMKQQVYEYALNPDGKITKVANIFLLPALSEDNLSQPLFCMGRVRMPVLRHARPIYLCKVQPTVLWECYLQGRSLNQQILWNMAAETMEQGD